MGGGDGLQCCLQRLVVQKFALQIGIGGEHVGKGDEMAVAPFVHGFYFQSAAIFRGGSGCKFANVGDNALVANGIILGTSDVLQNGIGSDVAVCHVAASDSGAVFQVIEH